MNKKEIELNIIKEKVGKSGNSLEYLNRKSDKNTNNRNKWNDQNM